MAKDFPSPAEAPSPVLGGVEVERAPAPAPIVFVGGTGRSGTHVLSQLISRHARFGLVPVEVRFHTDADGFPGLLAGQVSPEQFVRRLRGFWWRGFQTSRMRGMYRFVDRERFEAAVAEFEAEFAYDPEDACRRLFFALLEFRTGPGRTVRGIVEQSCDTVAQAPILVRLFPTARFVHVVRDGRDASASRVAQTWGLVRPRTREAGIRWWEERITRIEAGAVAVPPERLLTMSLDEILLAGNGAVLRPLFRFCGTKATRKVRFFYSNRMNRVEAHSDRWREGISRRRAERLEAAYEEALARLEAAGARSAPLLRRTLERSRDDPDLPPLPYVYDGPSR